MGVFTSSRQVRQNINLMPAWWLSGASIDLDFDNQRYYDSSLGGSASLALLNSYLSISRASTKYAKTAAGLLTSFANDTLAITDLGLLVEDARTNVLKQSADQTSSPTWQSLASETVSGDVAVAPDGTSTADKIITANTTTQDGRFNGGYTTSGATTVSAYFKAAGFNFAFISNNAGSNRSAFVFNLTTGAITTTNTTGTVTGVVNTVEALSNGWWRASATINQSATEMGCGPVDSGTPASWSGFNFPNVVGNGTDGCYVWGAQIEQGAFASSYIPTTGASATRAADSVSITGTANSLINAATGSIVAQLGNTAGGSFAANVIDSNGTNCLGFNASNNALASITATLATSNTGNRSATDDKLALGWAASARSLVLNGGTVATDTSSQTPSATQKLGSASGSSNFIFSYIERLTLWNSKLANATLQSLTAP